VFSVASIRNLGLVLLLILFKSACLWTQTPVSTNPKHSPELQVQLIELTAFDTLAVWFKSSIYPNPNPGVLSMGSDFYQWKGRRMDWENLASSWFLDWADVAPTKGQAESETANSQTGFSFWTQSNGIARPGSGIRLGLNDDGMVGPHPDFGQRLYQQNASFTGALADHADQLSGMLAGSGLLEPAGRGYLPGAQVQVWNYSVDPSQNSGFFAFPAALYTDSVVVLNTSYGDGCNTGYTALAAFLDQQLELSPELGLVFSAGNSGSADCGFGAGPGWGNITGGHKLAKNALVVGNILNSNLIAPSSSRGPSTDGRIKPDLVAPGNLQYTTSGFSPTGYTLQSGSSISATAATAAFALLQQQYRMQHGSFAPSSLIRAHLLNTALDFGLPGPDFTYGFGLIQSDLALKALQQEKDSLLWLQTGDTVWMPLHLTHSTAQLKVTLCWNDPAGSPLSASPLVNDIDLAMKTPAGSWILPWVPNPSVNALGQAAIQNMDHLNTVEQISVPILDTGVYWIRISASSLLGAGQECALVWQTADSLPSFKFPTTGQSATAQDIVSVDFYTTKPQSNLEFSSNLGQSWQVLASNLSMGNHRIDHALNSSFLSFGAIYRLSHLGQEQLRSPRLPVLPMADSLHIDTLCANRLRMRWHADPSVPYWLVFELSDTNQTPVDTVTGNQWISTQDWGGIQRFWAVAAMDIWGGIGRRCRAISAGDSLIRCAAVQDLSLDNIVFPHGNSISSCLFSQNLPLTCSISNQGAQNSGPVVLTAKVNGQLLVSDTLQNLPPNSSLLHTFSQALSPTGGNQMDISIRLFTAQDDVPWNDTLHRIYSLYAQNEAALPHLETFENSSTCPNISDCQVPECQASNPWINDAGNPLDWRIHSGPSPSQGTGPSSDAMPASSTGKYLYLESSLCAQSSSYAFGPCFTGIPEPLYVYAALHAFGADAEKVELFLLGPTGMDSLKISSKGSHLGWETQKDTAITVPGAKYQLMLKGETGVGFRGDLAVDALWIDTLNLTVKPNQYPKVCQTIETVFSCSSTPPHSAPMFNLLDSANNTLIQTSAYSIPFSFAQAGNYLFSFSHPNAGYIWHGNIAVESPLSIDFSWQELGNGLVALKPNLSNVNCKWNTGDGQISWNSDTLFHTYLQNGQYLVRLWAENACGSDSIDKWIQVVGVGFSNPPSKDAWLIYPNPSSNQTTILSAQGEEINEINLKDLSGRNLMRAHPKAASYVLNIEMLPAGSYLLECKTNERILLFKLLKTNP